MNLRTIFKVAAGVSRPPFLLLPLAVLFPVFAYASLVSGGWNLTVMGNIAVVAVAGLVAVNALNEYQDFNSGLDLQTRRTPFSGGSGVLPQHPQYSHIALLLSVLALLLTIVAGLHLVAVKGSELIFLGIAGIALIISYTRWLNRLPLLCLAAPGIGIGLLVVNGAGYVLLDRCSAGVFALSLMSGLLASSLLLLNQFPDIEADQAAGRRHYLIARGVQQSVRVFRLLLICAYFVLIAAVAMGVLPPPALAGLLTTPLAVKVVGQVFSAVAVQQVEGFRVDEAFVAAMGKNTALTLLTPFLSGLGMVLIGAI